MNLKVINIDGTTSIEKAGTIDSEVEAENEFELGRQALDKNDFETALAHFEAALELKDNPSWYPYVGLCISRGRGEFWRGAELCLASFEFELGRQALDKDDFETALAHFAAALALKDNPCWYSYVGLCISRGCGEFWLGAELCLKSLAVEPENTTHHLNLGKVYLAAGNKMKALHTLRDGLAKGGNENILQVLAEMGVRNTPVFKSLPRSNPLNKFLGILLR